jgi:hypothetical protein
MRSVFLFSFSASTSTSSKLKSLFLRGISSRSVYANHYIFRLYYACFRSLFGTTASLSTGQSMTTGPCTANCNASPSMETVLTSSLEELWPPLEPSGCRCPAATIRLDYSALSLIALKSQQTARSYYVFVCSQGKSTWAERFLTRTWRCYDEHPGLR